MSAAIRIISKLEIKGPNLVKGIHLEGLRVLGKPEQFARHYYESGVDELIYMDVVASLYNRNSLHEIIRKTADEIFIPLTVGGGLRTLEDIESVLKAGADKVSINTAAVRDPGVIKEAARKFGSSTIVISIEAIRQPDGRYFAYTDNGREHAGKEAVEWAERVEELGAGEILLVSVDRDGTGAGFDIELTRMVAGAVSIPVIACGGAGRLQDLRDCVIDGKADALSVSSMLHYDYIKNHNRIDKDAFNDEGNIEYLKNHHEFSKIETANLQNIKSYLLQEGLLCRYDI